MSHLLISGKIFSFIKESKEMSLPTNFVWFLIHSLLNTFANQSFNHTMEFSPFHSVSRI